MGSQKGLSLILYVQVRGRCEGKRRRGGSCGTGARRGGRCIRSSHLGLAMQERVCRMFRDDRENLRDGQPSLLCGELFNSPTP